MKVRILSTSDVHGNFFPTNYASQTDYHPFGYLKAASVIDQIRQQNPDDIILYIENGDFLEGSPLTDYAYQTKDAACGHYHQNFAKILNMMAPDAVILGNHEFNYSPEYLESCYQGLKAPILAANIKEGPNSHIITAPYRIVEQKGVKIAIIGLTTQYIPHWEKPEHISGWHFEAAASAAKRTIAQFRNQVDLIVVAYHGGFEKDLTSGQPTEKLTGENEGYELLTNVPGIDALVTGHQHRKIATVKKQIPTTQPGFRGETVGMLTLDLDSNKHVAAASSELLDVKDAPLKADMMPLVNNLQAKVQTWLDQPLAQIDGGMNITDHMQARMFGHPYLALVNQVQMDALGVDISGTSLFNDEVRGLDEVVTMRNVMNSYVYPNTLAVEEISGQDLYDALERSASFFELNADGTVGISAEFSTPKVELYNYDYYSGIDYTIDITKPKGQRITALTYHNHPVAKDQKLKVVINQYRGVGGGNYPMFSADKMVKVDENPVAGLIVAYLKKHDHLTAKQPTNLTFIK